jgi:hypothetical protein
MKPSYCILLLSVFSCLPVSAQFDFSTDETAKAVGGPRLGVSQKQVYRAGIEVQPGVSMEQVRLSVPVPMEWNEQKITKVDEEKIDIELSSQIKYRTLNNGAREMILEIKKMSPTKPAEVVIAFELENFELLPPKNTEQYIIPKKVPKSLEQYLKESPAIECHDGRFTKMFKEITKEKTTDWEKVEAVYSFVQNNVQYDEEGRNRPVKGAIAVIKMPKGEWKGDCKDMSCLFVALCRAGKVPARIVRVPEHCYAEFYLEQKLPENAPKKTKADGFWFPCQVSGSYAFGGIPEKRPILQKGDSFPDPDNFPKGKTLFLKECFEGTLSTDSPPPKFKWIHEVKAK